MAQETLTVSPNKSQEDVVEVVDEPDMLQEGSLAAVTPVLAPSGSPAEVLVQGIGESPQKDDIEGLESTTSSFMENVNSFCLTQSRADPPPTLEDSHLVEFNSTTSSYLANINSNCAADQPSPELSWAPMLNSSDMPTIEPPYVCVAEWMKEKPTLSLLSEMSNAGDTQASVSTPSKETSLGELDFDNVNSCISSILPGCVCLLDETCVACAKHVEIRPVSVAPSTLDGLWDHLVAVSRLSFTRLPKRKVVEDPTTTKRPNPPLSPESLSKEFKKMKLLENQHNSTPGPNVPHT